MPSARECQHQRKLRASGQGKFDVPSVVLPSASWFHSCGPFQGACLRAIASVCCEKLYGACSQVCHCVTQLYSLVVSPSVHLQITIGLPFVAYLRSWFTCWHIWFTYGYTSANRWCTFWYTSRAPVVRRWCTIASFSGALVVHRWCTVAPTPVLRWCTLGTRLVHL